MMVKVVMCFLLWKVMGSMACQFVDVAGLGILFSRILVWWSMVRSWVEEGHTVW